MQRSRHTTMQGGREEPRPTARALHATNIWQYIRKLRLRAFDSRETRHRNANLIEID